MRFLRVAGWVAVFLLVFGPPTWFALALFGYGIPTDFEDRYHEIQDGMTLAEVHAVLGNETDELESLTTPDGNGGQRKLVHGDRLLQWRKEGQFIYVGFTNDRVVSKYFTEYSL